MPILFFGDVLSTEAYPNFERIFENRGLFWRHSKPRLIWSQTVGHTHTHKEGDVAVSKLKTISPRRGGRRPQAGASAEWVWGVQRGGK